MTPPIIPEQDETPSGIVWLKSSPGRAASGGGECGNKMKEPPRQVQLPGKDKISVPVTKPPELEVPKETKAEPNPCRS